MNDPHAALIHTMVLVSAADGDMTDQEIHRIGEIISYLPVFRDFDRDRLADELSSCADLLSEDDGLARMVEGIQAGLPGSLAETAYAIACDVAAADGQVGPEEMRVLEMIRHGLDLDRLIAAAIERGARARHQTL